MIAIEFGLLITLTIHSHEDTLTQCSLIIHQNHKNGSLRLGTRFVLVSSSILLLLCLPGIHTNALVLIQLNFNCETFLLWLRSCSCLLSPNLPLLLPLSHFSSQTAPTNALQARFDQYDSSLTQNGHPTTNIRTVAVIGGCVVGVACVLAVAVLVAVRDSQSEKLPAPTNQHTAVVAEATRMLV